MRLRIECGVLGVARRSVRCELCLRRSRLGLVLAHLRVDESTRRLECVDLHVLGEAAGAATRVDGLAGDAAGREADVLQPCRLRLRCDPCRGHVRSTGDLLLLQLADHGVLALGSESDCCDAERYEDGCGNDSTNLEKPFHDDSSWGSADSMRSSCAVALQPPAGRTRNL